MLKPKKDFEKVKHRAPHWDPYGKSAGVKIVCSMVYRGICRTPVFLSVKNLIFKFFTLVALDTPSHNNLITLF
jgi:hypothetical protein